MIRMMANNLSNDLAGLPALERDALGSALPLGLEALFSILLIGFDPISEGLTGDAKELSDLDLLSALKNSLYGPDTDLLLGRR